MKFVLASLCLFVAISAARSATVTVTNTNVNDNSLITAATQNLNTVYNTYPNVAAQLEHLSSLMGERDETLQWVSVLGVDNFYNPTDSNLYIQMRLVDFLLTRYYTILSVDVCVETTTTEEPTTTEEDITTTEAEDVTTTEAEDVTTTEADVPTEAVF